MSCENNGENKSIQYINSNVPVNILKNITAVIAIPIFEQGSKKIMRNEKKVTRKFWRVLLDSKSDGDVIFLNEEAKSKFLIKKKLNSQKWHLSAGYFSSSKVSNVEFKIPEFSKSMMISLSPDMVRYSQEYQKC